MKTNVSCLLFIFVLTVACSSEERSNDSNDAARNSAGSCCSGCTGQDDSIIAYATPEEVIRAWYDALKGDRPDDGLTCMVKEDRERYEKDLGNEPKTKSDVQIVAYDIVSTKTDGDRSVVEVFVVRVNGDGSSKTLETCVCVKEGESWRLSLRETFKEQGFPVPDD